MIRSKSFFVALTSAVLAICSGEVLQCEPDKSKLCTAKCDGQEVDIATILPYPYIAENKKDDYEYKFEPCGTGLKCNGGTSDDNALCQDATDGKTGFSIGKVSQASYSRNSTDPYIFTVLFAGGDDNRQSLVTFHYDENGDSKLKYVGEDPTLNYNFEMRGPRIGQPSGGGGGGDIAGPIGIVLIFLAIIGLCTYFIVGALVMHFVYGAKGQDNIPNVNFWMDFPFLLRDGILFTISPCYKRESAGGYKSVPY